ncbi:hypothetical protein E3N88_14924 [Mikania micrantha]|uniref:CCHC-type domain-containing protein n=1 Tax=Mikania micrantha TaxID=192012 RepID=A0A5N6P2T8_9ASTR|nr:hypothetical protein E3N88_14924 [Mikania micrantha]
MFSTYPLGFEWCARFVHPFVDDKQCIKLTLVPKDCCNDRQNREVNRLSRSEIIDNEVTWLEVVGRLKAFEERTKKQIKEDDMHYKLLFTKGDGKEKVKEHKCERCGHENSNQDNKGRRRGKNWKSWNNKDGNRFQQSKDHIKCFKCKGFGHFKHECPKREKKEEANLIRHEDDEPTLL